MQHLISALSFIIITLNFPRLQRGRTNSAREQDCRAITLVTFPLYSEGNAWVNFVTGPKLGHDKQLKQRSPYQYLLKPRVAGFEWHAETHHSSSKPSCRYCDITNISQWLNERWPIKDQLIHRAIGDK